MRVKRFNSNKEILINTKKYLINWENSGASSLETRFRDLIRPFWGNSIVLFQFRIPASLMRIDFFNINKRLAVEINGEQHDSYNEFFHKKSRLNYLSSIKRDMAKDNWCEQNKITILHLTEFDLDVFCPEYIYDKFGVNII